MYTRWLSFAATRAARNFMTFHISIIIHRWSVVTVWYVEFLALSSSRVFI